MQKRNSGRAANQDDRTLAGLLAYMNQCKHPDGVVMMFDERGPHSYCVLCGKEMELEGPRPVVDVKLSY